VMSPRMFRPAIWFLLFAACQQNAVPIDHGSCEVMIACASAVTPAATAGLIESYGTHGSCWADASYAATCRQACDASLVTFHDAHPDEAACGLPVSGEPIDEASADEACGEFAHAFCLQLQTCAPI